MIWAIKLSFYAFSSVVMAVILNRRVFLNSFGVKVGFFWLLVLPFIFIVKNELLTVCVCIAALLFLKRGMGPGEIIGFFIATLAAVPDWSHYTISLPGINNLTTLYFWKVSVLVLLFPLLFQIKNNPNAHWTLTDSFFCAFVLYISFMALREFNLTTFLRQLFDNVLLFIIPYFAISRFVVSRIDFHYFALGLFILALLMGGVLFVSQLVKLDIYRFYNIYIGWFNNITEYRGGFLRLNGPFVNSLSGYIMGLGFIALLVVRGYFPSGRICFLCITFILISGLFFTGSRGALLSVFVLFSIYLYFAVLQNKWRFLTFLAILPLFFAVLFFDFPSSVSYEDKYGTFEYRQEMYKASFAFIKTSPIFGDEEFLSSGYFDHLVTGLGIIDVVSVYLQVVLKYGFVGLFLYVMPFILIACSLSKKLFFSSVIDKEQLRYLSMLFGALIAYLLLIGTVSHVSLIFNFGVLVLGLCRSISCRGFQ